MSTIYGWSLHAIFNENIDPAILWKEHQAPSTVNNSGRAMMQRIAEYISDTNGSRVGQPQYSDDQLYTEYKIQLTSNITKYYDHMFIRFKAEGTNKGKTTISLNGLRPAVVYMADEHGYKEIMDGNIQNGGLYEAVYKHGGKRTAGSWFLLNPTPVEPPHKHLIRLFPPGTIAAFAMQAVPRGWLYCDGAAVSRTEYKDLLDAIGLTWGIGDGATTFNIPDLRGMFLRGFDGNRGIDRNRQFGTIQQAAFKVHEADIEAGGATWAHLAAVRGSLPLAPQDRMQADESDGAAQPQSFFDHTHEITTEFVGGAETRPINVAISYAIKT